MPTADSGSGAATLRHQLRGVTSATASGLQAWGCHVETVEWRLLVRRSTIALNAGAHVHTNCGPVVGGGQLGDDAGRYSPSWFSFAPPTAVKSCGAGLSAGELI